MMDVIKKLIEWCAHGSVAVRAAGEGGIGVSSTNVFSAAQSGR